MIEIIAFFLAVSFVLYTIFGGADFGAGILELACSRDRKHSFREIVTKAISPVWEANHIWIILVIVILFTAYPKAYSEISTTFHIPLLIMLLGIVFRGCAFVFRHYDTEEGMSKELYSGIFSISSLLTPFSQGVIAGGLILGETKTHALSFRALYIDSWFNFFAFSTGIFFTCMCALTASVFLFCETTTVEFKSMLKRRIHQISILTLVAGGLVFLTGESDSFSLFTLFFSRHLSIAAFFAALLTIILINYYSRSVKNRQIIRILICVFITFVLCGWWNLQFPYLLGIPENGNHNFNIYESASSEAVLKQLVIALILGSILIFPALFYLIHVFKYKKA